MAFRICFAPLPLVLGLCSCLLFSEPTSADAQRPNRLQLEIAPCGLCLLLCCLKGPSDLQTLQEGEHEYPTPPRDQTFHDASLQDQLKGPPACQHSAEDFDSAIHSVHRLLAFYEGNVEQFNLRQDGGVGLMILKNVLEDILARKIDSLSPAITAVLTELLASASVVGPKIFEFSLQAETDLERLQDLRALLENPALLTASPDWQPYDTVNELLPEFMEAIGNEREVIYPKLDFQCLVALADDCAVPTVCRKLYLEEPYSQYMLLHQVLYLQMANARGCIERATRAREFGNWRSLRDRLCAKAYAEAEWLAEREFPVRFRDLFSEQVAFCGLAGYASFMRGDWLREILSWQARQPAPGCFPDIYGEKRTTDEIVKAEYADGTRSEECLVHLSSVSLGAVAMNLRYMMDVCPATVTSTSSLSA